MPTYEGLIRVRFEVSDDGAAAQVGRDLQFLIETKNTHNKLKVHEIKIDEVSSAVAKS